MKLEIVDVEKVKGLSNYYVSSYLRDSPVHIHINLLETVLKWRSEYKIVIFVCGSNK